MQNISGRELNDVVALVTYPDDDMVGGSASSNIGISGAFRSGSLLTEYPLGILASDQIVTLNITTQLPNRSGIFTGTLTASITGIQQQDQATLTLLAVQELPDTGETPLARNLLLALLGTVTLVGFMSALRSNLKIRK